MSSRAASAGRGRQRSPTSVASPDAQAQQQQHGKNDGGDDGAPPPPPPGTAKQVTPPLKRGKASSKPRPKKRRENPDMVCKDVYANECILILGVIGSSAVDGDGNESIVPVEDCVKWLQDLQRVLRRDHDVYRPISLFLGQSRAVAQKLLPLAVGCRYDKDLVLTLCKILVILTKPMSPAAKNAGRMTIDVKSGKVDEDVIHEQRGFRKNGIEQSDLLMEYKRLFVRHSTHHYALKNRASHPSNDNDEEGADENCGTGLMSIFVSLLSEPLAKTGSMRTAQDHLTIELVLHLIRNLLCISPLNTFGSTEKAQHASQLHRELIIVLKEEMVLDVLVCIGQEVERRENAGYNLLLMEIVSHLLRGQDPSDVALSAFKAPAALSAPVKTSSTKKSSTASKTRIVRTTTTTSRASSGGANSLKGFLQTERQNLQLSASSRHGHFGGTLLVSKLGGKQTYVSASDYLAKKSKRGSKASASAASKEGTTAGLNQPMRRKNKKAEVFLGSGKSSALHTRPGASAASTREVAGPTSKRAYRALNSFCLKFIEDCYGPVMKSLKNEFRRDSNRLEDGDRTMFFRIVWFFHQWWRVGMEQRQTGKKNIMPVTNKAGKVVGEIGDKSTAQNLVFTMDVFMFNLVLNSTDEFFEHKKPAALAHTVALYTEMIHMLHAMYNSADTTERNMALGLMDRVFYADEPLDRLPKLLSRWAPGMYSREYLCDLVNCTHVQWKLLDMNAQRTRETAVELKRPNNAVERFDITASEFDKDHYFMRKFVSNQIVFMYTQLLSRYDVNAALVNRHVVAYFIRLCKFSIKNAGADEGMEFDDEMGKNELARQESTLEPMLYNIGLFTVLDRVLNDRTIRDNEGYEALLMFASSFMKRFARAAEINPMLYVEALFKHPAPHRFCDLATNMYVNEELRMIAIRDLLLADQKRYEQEDDVDEATTTNAGTEGSAGVEKVAEKAQEDDDDEEEELEFNDDDMDEDVIVPKKKSRRKSKKKRKLSKAISTPSDEEDTDEELELGEKGDTPDGGDKENEEQQKESPAHEAGAGGPKDAMMDLSDSDGDEASPSAKNGVSPKLSGKKRIRKSLDKVNDDDSDDDDAFLGSAAVPAKLPKRVIFDDDDDDD